VVAREALEADQIMEVMELILFLVLLHLMVVVLEQQIKQ
jgi:hypothetical protein